MSTHVEISKSLVLVNSVSAVLQRILTLGLVFWLNQRLILHLAPTELALFYVLFAVMMFVPLISVVLSSGLARFVIERQAKGDERGVVQVVSTTAPICVAVGALVLVLGGAVVATIEHVVTVPPELVDDARVMLGLMVAMAAVRIALMPFMVGLQVVQRLVATHVIGLVSQVLYAGVVIALLLGVSTRALWVPVAMVPSTLFEVAAMMLLSRHAMPSLRFDRREFRRELVRPLVAFGGWTMVARVMAVARETCGTLVLNELPASRPELARHAAAAEFRQGALPESRIFPMMLMPLSTTLPAITAMHAMGQEARLRRTYFRLTRYVLWIYLFVSLPLMVYHWEIWELYTGNEYPAASVVMLLLLAKAIIVFPQPVMAQVVTARARTQPMALRAVAIEASTVAAMVVAITAYGAGAIGAAAVSLGVCFVLHPLLMWPHALHLVSATFREWSRATLGPGVVPALGALPVWLALHWVAPPDTWVELGAQASLGCAVYVAMLVGLCLEPSEQDDMIKAVSRTRMKIMGRRAGAVGPGPASRAS